MSELKVTVICFLWHVSAGIRGIKYKDLWINEQILLSDEFNFISYSIL